jgi:hypothetical protein
VLRAAAGAAAGWVEGVAAAVGDAVIAAAALTAKLAWPRKRRRVDRFGAANVELGSAFMFG